MPEPYTFDRLADQAAERVSAQSMHNEREALRLRIKLIEQDLDEAFGRAEDLGLGRVREGLRLATVLVGNCADQVHLRPKGAEHVV